MPNNDSAGVGIYLNDKSQRASTAIGFRSAGAIEADRGLCNTPTLISSDADYVKVFGTPSLERHGQAALEAYLLSQRKVPQYLTRAKNPMFTGNENVFGLAKFSLDGGELVLNTDTPARKIVAPVDDSTVLLYFKGEGDYAKKKADTGVFAPKNASNIVLRFSKPLSQSAYAKSDRTLRVQVFDFNGANHIDQDTPAALAFNPDVSNVIDDSGYFKLDGYDVYAGGGSDGGETTLKKLSVTTFVNGRPATQEFSYDDIVDNNCGVYDWVTSVICDVTDSEGDKIIKNSWLEYTPANGSGSDGGDMPSNGFYYLHSFGDDGYNGRQQLNAFDLSIAVTMDVTLPIYKKDGGRRLSNGFYGFPCGSVTVSGVDAAGEYGIARFVISTNLYLKNRNSYMYMGLQNEYWASYYQDSYCMEDYTVSMTGDDHDANNLSMQASAVLSSSNYLVAKSSDTFRDYSIDYDSSPITTKLHYFGGEIVSNSIAAAQKSVAYSMALQGLLADNLVRYRCIVAPNLGDGMVSGDYVSAITAASESTLGLSNIGRAASTDIFGNGGNNMGGRHGNRFIMDYAQYAYRTIAGRSMAVTVACLVADLLNQHYNAGIPARPPFGYNYGQIACLSLSQQYTGAERLILANQFKINPVIDEEGGFYLWKECTSQLTNTSLSDGHSILSFVYMKFAIYDAMKAFVAEYNDPATINRGLTILNDLNETFKKKNFIEEGMPNADKNVLGDEVMRFDYPVRFKGVANYVDVYITAYSQTKTLAISLAEEA